MAQTLDAVAVRSHLTQKTTQDLCDDYEHLAKSQRRMPWAEQAISDALFERNSDAWFAWNLESGLFGRPMPHRFYCLK